MKLNEAFEKAIEKIDREVKMELKEVVTNTLKELVLPDLKSIKEENKEIKNGLTLINQRLDDVNKRLDDVNLHLADQSRRIDETNKRIDETNKRIDRLYEVIVRRDEHNKLEQRLLSLEKEVTEINRLLKKSDAY